MIELMLAQAETVAKAAQDLLTANEVLPFFQASTALGFVVAGFFFYKWQASEAARDGDRAAELARLQKINERLTGAKEGESRA